jgi:hypothetical protein
MAGAGAPRLGCVWNDGGSRLSPRGAGSAEYWFDSLPEMVATTDAVILGTVVELSDGTAGPPGEEIELLNVEAQVNDSFYGSVNETSTLTVQTHKLVEPEREWRDTGNTVLAFLKLSSDPVDEGRYYGLNDQTIYVVVDRDIQTAVEGDPLSEQIGSMSVGQLRKAIDAAIPAIESGEVTPQVPVGG